MKKILILTLKQGANYGGMLQAYALQTVLKEQGYLVETTWTKGPILRRMVKLIPGLKFSARILKGVKKPLDQSVVTKYTLEFVRTHIDVVSFDKALIKSKSRRYDAYVVGSDQVWRKMYTYVPHNFLSFVNDDSTKISYAASFGKDNVDEYGPQAVRSVTKLIRRFDGVSVREQSGVNVVVRNFDSKAEFHVDPTLLVSKEVYASLFDSNASAASEGPKGIFSYVLDPAHDKQSVAKIVSDNMSLKLFTIINGDENNGNPMPPVERWLQSFSDAEFVVTDSFHGVVFSIIFNKPFIAIGNKERGLARFTSLLSIFGLEDRLVSGSNEITPELISAKIDWKKVNDIKARERQRSLNYLKKHLGK